jgi:hypothetical protein
MHNKRSWYPDSCNGTIVRSFRKEFSINIWCGIILNTLIEHHFCEGALTGRIYLSFVQSELLLLRKTFFSRHQSICTISDSKEWVWPWRRRWRPSRRTLTWNIHSLSKIKVSVTALRSFAFRKYDSLDEFCRIIKKRTRGCLWISRFRRSGCMFSIRNVVCMYVRTEGQVWGIS